MFKLKVEFPNAIVPAGRSTPRAPRPRRVRLPAKRVETWAPSENRRPIRKFGTSVMIIFL
jgi:hypothetical protein